MDSALISALSYGIFGPSLDYILSAFLRQCSPPPGLRLSKFFFRPQLERTKTMLDEVRALGSAAVEGWMKGLGQERLERVTKFERWELSGDFEKATMHRDEAAPDTITLAGVEIPDLIFEASPCIGAAHEERDLRRSPHQSVINLLPLGKALRHTSNTSNRSSQAYEGVSLVYVSLALTSQQVKFRPCHLRRPVLRLVSQPANAEWLRMRKVLTD